MAQYPSYTRSDGKVFPVEKFGSIIKRWAAEANMQLDRGFAMQKMWNGTEANSVWTKYRKRAIINNRQKREVVSGGSWSWFQESNLRAKLDKQAGPSQGEYWYSTGHSADISQVTVTNASIESAEIDFLTTAGELFAEAGVGLNGRYAVRGARGKGGRKRIKVDRSKPWHHNKRYVGTWNPGKGKAHRPIVKQQMSLLRRRLIWAANTIFLRDLSIYLGASMEEAWMAIGKLPIPTGAADGSFEVISLDKKK